MNTYICFYKKQRTEIQAKSSLTAQDAAAEHFKAKKACQFTVVLAGRNNNPVIHSTSSL